LWRIGPELTAAAMRGSEASAAKSAPLMGSDCLRRGNCPRGSPVGVGVGIAIGVDCPAPAKPMPIPAPTPIGTTGHKIVFHRRWRLERSGSGCLYQGHRPSESRSRVRWRRASSSRGSRCGVMRWTGGRGAKATPRRRRISGENSQQTSRSRVTNVAPCATAAGRRSPRTPPRRGSAGPAGAQDRPRRVSMAWRRFSAVARARLCSRRRCAGVLRRLLRSPRLGLCVRPRQRKMSAGAGQTCRMRRHRVGVLVWFSAPLVIRRHVSRRARKRVPRRYVRVRPVFPHLPTEMSCAHVGGADRWKKVSEPP